MKRLALLQSALIILFSLAAWPAFAEPLRIAVASNFLAPAHALAEQYRADTGQVVKVSAGSTGKLYAQIVNGAPYDLFLAANAREPERLEAAGLTVPDSRFTYALGRLVLWSADGQRLKEADGAAWLQRGDYARLAVANPRTAPYGAAALQVLADLGVTPAKPGRLVVGENVGQAYQFAASGNVDAGFVALSQVLAKPGGSYWQVPPGEYAPIAQQVVWLKRAQHRTEARAFIDWLRSAKVAAVIAGFGYGVEARHDG